jgi:hypothetical protein
VDNRNLHKNCHWKPNGVPNPSSDLYIGQILDLYINSTSDMDGTPNSDSDSICADDADNVDICDNDWDFHAISEFNCIVYDLTNDGRIQKRIIIVHIV